jgi:hypothetical protein
MKLVDCGKEEHEDEKLSGTFSDAGPVPEAPATGTVKGNKVVFGWYVKESRTSYTAVFKGAIESATKMKGSIRWQWSSGSIQWQLLPSDASSHILLLEG